MGQTDLTPQATSALCLALCLALTFLLASLSAAPLGSISSMEVNVDVLEQMDMMDLTDQDTVDVFLGCGTEESSSSGPGTGSQSALWCSTGAVPAPSIPPAAHSSALAALLCQSPIPALSVPVYTHTPCTKTAP